MAEESRYFYHNFPRNGNGNVELGLNVLKSMLRSGLLFVPEVTKLKDAKGNVLHPVIQQRICFTELSRSEIEKHAEQFGDFALEYDQAELRRLGAMPVIYIPGAMAQNGLEGAGKIGR